MEHEGQICSYQLAQRLRLLGTPQEALFWYVDGKQPGDLKADPAIVYGGGQNWANKTLCAAYTVAELGAMLPPYFGSTRVRVCDIFSRMEVETAWLCYDRNNEVHSCMETSEANARALMLIDLIMQGKVNVKEIGRKKADFSQSTF